MPGVMRSLAGPVGRVLARVLMAIGLCFVLVTITPVTAIWAQRLAGGFREPPGEVLIVLGGPEPVEGMIAGSSYWRSVYAVLAYRKTPFRKVVVTGTFPAESMRQFLICNSVPADVIVVDQRARNTRENALNVSQIVGRMPGRKVLLTSDYHMFRARRSFAKLGVEVHVWPIPDAVKRSSSWNGRWPAFLDLSLETCKITYYVLRGWI